MIHQQVTEKAENLKNKQSLPKVSEPKVSTDKEILNKLRRKEQEIIKLRCENEVLRHCWDKAKQQIDKLAKEINLLQRHLNP